jgi:hypothetical protein
MNVTRRNFITAICGAVASLFATRVLSKETTNYRNGECHHNTKVFFKPNDVITNCKFYNCELMGMPRFAYNSSFYNCYRKDGDFILSGNSANITIS